MFVYASSFVCLKFETSRARDGHNVTKQAPSFTTLITSASVESTLFQSLAREILKVNQRFASLKASVTDDIMETVKEDLDKITAIRDKGVVRLITMRWQTVEEKFSLLLDKCVKDFFMFICFFFFHFIAFMYSIAFSTFILLRI